MVETARRILHAPLPSVVFEGNSNWLADLKARNQAERAKEIIQDEIAYARLRARRGQQPEPDWLVEKDDPRLEAWRAAVWCDIERHLRTVEHSRDVVLALGNLRLPSPALLRSLWQEIETLEQACALLALHLENTK